jgi:signal transduction histidine kinase
MTKEAASRLFNLDSLSSTPGTENEKGSGFGLLLCKELLEINGSWLSVESEIGKGSVFSFVLQARTVIKSELISNDGKIELNKEN